MTFGGIGRQCFRRLATVAKTVCRRLVGRVIRTTRRELSATTAAAAAVAKGYIIMYTRGEPASGRRDASQVENRRRAVGCVGGQWTWGCGTENSIIATRRPFRPSPPRLCDAHRIFRIQLSRH